jgi:hypothetical protein
MMRHVTGFSGLPGVEASPVLAARRVPEDEYARADVAAVAY